MPEKNNVIALTVIALLFSILEIVKVICYTKEGILKASKWIFFNYVPVEYVRWTSYLFIAITFSLITYLILTNAKIPILLSIILMPNLGSILVIILNNMYGSTRHNLSYYFITFTTILIISAFLMALKERKEMNPIDILYEYKDTLDDNYLDEYLTILLKGRQGAKDLMNAIDSFDCIKELYEALFTEYREYLNKDELNAYLIKYYSALRVTKEIEDIESLSYTVTSDNPANILDLLKMLPDLRSLSVKWDCIPLNKLEEMSKELINECMLRGMGYTATVVINDNKLDKATCNTLNRLRVTNIIIDYEDGININYAKEFFNVAVRIDAGNKELEEISDINIILTNAKNYKLTKAHMLKEVTTASGVRYVDIFNNEIKESCICCKMIHLCDSNTINHNECMYERMAL